MLCVCVYPCVGNPCMCRCSLRHLGLQETIVEARHWVYGEEYLVAQRPLSEMVQHLAHGLQVQHHWEARAIRVAGSSSTRGIASLKAEEDDSEAEEDASFVEIVSTDGRVVQAKYVVVAVPLTVLQRGSLSFQPPLGPEKAEALRLVHVGNAMKLVISFTRKFWHPKFFDAVCVDTLFPEIWVTKREPTRKCGDGQGVVPAHGGVACVTFFVAGEAATSIASMGEQRILEGAMAQLDEMFPISASLNISGRYLLISQARAHRRVVNIYKALW